MSNLGKQIPVRTTYVRTKEERFEAGVHSLLQQYVPVYTPVRLVFFRNIADNQEYLRQLDFIRGAVARHFPSKIPVVTLVSQTPLGIPKGLLMEISEVRTEKQDLIQYKNFEKESYLTITHPGGKTLYLGGILCPENTLPVKEQTDFIFHVIGQILNLESMPIHSIVRQWNYIEKITGFDGDYQRYQAFNDARSRFYERTDWPRGYPAATGIGTFRGGIVVELQAHHPANASYQDVAVGNWLQVPAYEYSPQVLCGQENEAIREKTTPKFERAKILFRGEDSPFIYVSGTAAIRGEISLGKEPVISQTQATIENIEGLICRGNLSHYGIETPSDGQWKHMRVYIKKPEFFDEVHTLMDKLYPEIPVAYLLADICRDELLVEIEGLAVYSGYKN